MINYHDDDDDDDDDCDESADDNVFSQHNTDDDEANIDAKRFASLSLYKNSADSTNNSGL